jgi:PPK2 family polyphosphate:nucleotide phosphotransferase
MINFQTSPAEDIDEKKIRATVPLLTKHLGELQARLYAESTRGLLVILQGMDASGKDGAIKNVFAEVNPMGLHVTSFKKPSENELAHDYLWRVHNAVPPSGIIGIFNRSHYEDILVPSVEKYLPETVISKRYEHINAFESMLIDSGIHIVKFFLSVSAEKQKERLEERLTDPKKFWKHKDSDWVARSKRDAYLEVYQSLFEKCNVVPWNTIASDKNWYRDYLIAGKIIDELEKINPAWPPLVTNMKI